MMKKLFLLIKPFDSPNWKLDKHKKTEIVVWLKNIIEKTYYESEYELSKIEKFENIEIKISLITAEPYIPDSLYAIRDSILLYDFQ